MCNCRISEFGEKEVINLIDGARLGCVTDVLFETDTGKIVAIIVPARKDSFFDRGREYEIPWCDIERVGYDFIFVRFSPPLRPMPKKKGLFG